MIWGRAPSPTALEARDIFRKHNLESVMVPGAGYGRNTKVFSREFNTYGIELSGAALEIATGTLLEPETYEYKENKYAHFFSETDLRQHFQGTDILATASYVETLGGHQGNTHQYILRVIVARKF